MKNRNNTECTRARESSDRDFIVSTRRSPIHSDYYGLPVGFSTSVYLALEYCIFAGLQKAVFKTSIYRNPAMANELCFQLGQVLLRLRRCTIINRLNNLSQLAGLEHLLKVLYYYYWASRARLPNDATTRDLDSVQQTCWNGCIIDEYFPHEEGIEGWEAWMEQGKQLAEQIQPSFGDDRQNDGIQR